MIAADALSNNIIHVSDLNTTLAYFGGAIDAIPRDRLVDGLDPSAALLMDDESKGRRDHVIVYSVASPKAIVKDQLKLNLPGAGESAILDDFLRHLPRHAREIPGLNRNWRLRRARVCPDSRPPHGAQGEISRYRPGARRAL